jgi:hypothetical protein
METISTTLTSDMPVAFFNLSSGNAAAVVYTVSVGEIVTSVMLGVLVVLQLLQMVRWKGYSDE